MSTTLDETLATPAEPIAAVAGAAVAGTAGGPGARATERSSLPALLAVVALVALYAPVIWETAGEWLTNENYSHGVFILPVSALLVWLQRDAIAKAVARPTAWGLLPLAGGLLLQTVGYLIQIRFVAMASIVPTIAGAVLLLHGPALWRIVRFPVFFLLFAATFPGMVIGPISNWIQATSAAGGSALMQALGYPILRQGNMIQIPGMTLEVADVCSGFKKMTALVAFSALYGYVFAIGYAKRAALVAAAIPIAVLANVARVGVLIAVASAGGSAALHAAHDWAEMAVLVLSFVLFVGLGKALGCKDLRFWR